MVLADRYRVVRRLGSGGTAVVFLCEDEILGRRVAVKRLHGYDDPDELRRFRREARLGASLSHPNLVAVYDTIDDDDGELIVMEYVEGPTLGEALAQGPLHPAEAIPLLGGIASALDHAHAHGIVHRDVKPANVLLAQGGPAKLADLGIASASHLTQTSTGEMIAGTLAYIAPERLQGRDAGPAGDIYALGAVAYETLSGERARRATTPAEALAEALSGDPPDLAASWPQAPAGAAAAIEAAMSPDPSERPRSAGELVDRLSAALDGSDEDAMAATVPLAAVPPGAGRRYRWPLIGAAAVLIGAAIAIAAASDGGGGSGQVSSHAQSKSITERTHPTAPVTTTTVTTVTTAPPVTPKPKPKPPKPPKDEHKPPGPGGGPPGQAKKGDQGGGGPGGGD